MAIRGWDGTTNRFGTTTQWLSPTTVTGNKQAIVFGNSAIGKGIAQDIILTEEVDDHKNIMEIGGAMMNGYSRADYVDESDAANVFSSNNASVGDVANTIAATNQSSLIIATS